MKNEKRSMTVTLNKSSGVVDSATCSCPAGKSGYCNHIMALLFEVADYSLTSIREEISCTSQIAICQWGIPGEAIIKAPVMSNHSSEKC